MYYFLKRITTYLLLATVSQSFAAAPTQQQQLAAYFASYGMHQLLAHIASYSEQLDLAISGSSQACFEQGFSLYQHAPQASLFEQSFPIGEHFQAKREVCKALQGERFYAHSEHSELFIFSMLMQQQSLDGLVELCSRCQTDNENQLYASLLYQAANNKFALNTLHIIEQNNNSVLSWHISGGLEFNSLLSDGCQIGIKRITTQQPLRLNTDSIIEWNVDNVGPKRYLRGELLLELGNNESVLLRLEQQGVWINEYIMSWPQLHAIGQPCLQQLTQ